jgi:hypothetical protein
MQMLDYVHIFKSVKAQLLQLYPFETFASSGLRVIANAILNFAVQEKDTAYSTSTSKTTYLDLKSQGVINLERSSNHSADLDFYVHIPYIWIYALSDFNDLDKHWNVMIERKTHILWQEFEDFNTRFWTLRLRLLRCLADDKTTTFERLFRGAYGNGFADVRFNLGKSSLKFEKLNVRYPADDTGKIPDSMRQLHKRELCVYENGKGAPWDLFFFLGDWLFAIQVKSSDAETKQPQVVSGNLISQEYNKCKKAFEGIRKQLGGEEKCPIKNWALLICSNGHRANNVDLKILPNNCFLVDNENFKNFYGYTFSSRTEFAAGTFV